jgi:hypothetical protein
MMGLTRPDVRASFRRELLDIYRATPDTLQALLCQVPEDEVRVGGSDEDAWSVVEIVCHLRDTEERALERVRRMLNEDHPAIPAYDQAALAEESGYRDQSLGDALATFLRIRAEQLALLEGLAPAEWERGGSHEESGEITVESLTAHMAAHDAIHLAQIARRISG